MRIKGLNRIVEVKRINLKVLSIECLILFFMLLTAIVNGQSNINGQIDFTSIHFRGIRPDDHIGKVPLRNPGRGLRIEDVIDLSTIQLNNLFYKDKDLTIHLKAEALKYEADSVSLVQTCLYLPLYENIAIPDSALQQLQIYFDTLRSMGMKVLFRLAYKINSDGYRGPKSTDMLHHMDQLQQLMHRNKDVILVVQAGFLVPDDQQQSLKNKIELDNNTKLTLLKKLLSVVPVPLQVQVASPAYKNLIPVGNADYERIGFYEDRIVIKADKMNGGLQEGSPSFEQLVRESASSIVDGALPRGSWSLGKDGYLIDGYKAAKLFRLQHFTSLSLIRNNIEDGDEKKYSMPGWRNVPVDPEQLRTDKMPFSKDYFTASTGNIVQLPVFDYIRDHLGYRIELQQLMLPAKRPDNTPIHLKLELINRGFSAVKHPCTVAFVLIDPTGKVFELPADGNPESWQPFDNGDLNYAPITHVIHYQGKLPLHLMPGKYKLGLWMADANTTIHYDHRYDIRCANGNMGWWISRDGRYGINLLTNLTISK